jgi:hypothetical protein
MPTRGLKNRQSHAREAPARSRGRRLLTAEMTGAHRFADSPTRKREGQS